MHDGCFQKSFAINKLQVDTIDITKNTVVYLFSCRLFGTGVERFKMATSQTGFVTSLLFVIISFIFNARGQSQTLSRSEKVKSLRF